MSSIRIVQGGMGVGVSGWVLARAVSRAGQLGVVSGTGLAIVMLRRLQCGDPGGHMRRALEHFPLRDVAERVLERYYIPGGKAADQPFKLSPLPQMEPSQAFQELVVAGNFAEVYLAKEGHAGAVGINFLEKLQLPTLPSLYGAMLAGVDYVLMGAGIPRFIPGALDALSQGQCATLPIDVDGAQPMSEQTINRFDPAEFCGGTALPAPRPRFIAIISSSILAMTLARKSNGRVDGFIVEGATAGGHNAPPRGAMQLNERGEPIYGPRDLPDLEKIRELGLPYWMAGGFADPQKVSEAIAQGAAGVQIGTAFAFCEESSIVPEIKRQAIERILDGSIDVFTDPLASPTGFPFKVMQIPGTLADADVYAQRERICDLGYLRKPYLSEDGQIGHRCAAEPIDDFVKKGGKEADTVGRKCICNALFGTIGLAQVQQNHRLEPAIVTSGDDLSCVARLLKPGAASYTAADVIEYLLANTNQPLPQSAMT